MVSATVSATISAMVSATTSAMMSATISAMVSATTSAMMSATMSATTSATMSATTTSAMMSDCGGLHLSASVPNLCDCQYCQLCGINLIKAICIPHINSPHYQNKR